MSIRRLFSSPVFSDEAQTRRARALQFTIWSILLAVNSQFFVVLYFLPQYWLRWLASLLTLNIICPLLLLLNRRGRTQLAGILLLVVLSLLVTVRALTAGGIHAPVLVAYIVNVLIAGLLFGGRGGLIAGIVYGLAGLGFVLLEEAGLLPENSMTPTTFSTWLNLAAYLEFMIIFQFLVNRSIKAVLNQVKQAEIALGETERRYREVFETTSDCIFLLDVTADGRFLCYRYNPACEKVIGLTTAEVVGRAPEQLFPPDLASAVTANYQRCVAEGSPIDYDEEITPLYGQRKCFHTTLIPVRNAEGRIFRIVGVAHNITERKEAEEVLRRSRDELETLVQERTAELQKVNFELKEVNAEVRDVNNELEAFSYSVSHDLRRPLRTVTGFTDLLLSDHACELSGDARNLLTMVKNGTSQMNQLIEALLNLSHIERQPLVRRPVNLTTLVQKTIKELLAEYPGRSMDIRVAELPECVGDPALLQQAFVNLLSNAMKYTRDRPVAEIDVGFKMEDAKPVYYVRDNGAGFDMCYADKLFGVFQRLHSTQEFAGTGVGLSIVRRIIHRHGGRIWAEAAVDRGATFYFTLPQPSQKPAPATDTTALVPCVMEAA